MIRKTHLFLRIIFFVLMFCFSSPNLVMGISDGTSCQSDYDRGELTRCESGVLYQCVSQYAESETGEVSFILVWSGTQCGSAQCLNKTSCLEPTSAPQNDGGGNNSNGNSGGDVIIPSYTDAGYSDFAFEGKSVGDIISALLPYIYVIAGLALLVMLIVGGIGLMTAAGDPDKIKEGQGRITMALVGFLIVFISYIVVQLIGVMLGMNLLG